MKILVPSHDHQYREAAVRKIKVVYNKRYREWHEYHGDEYLEDGEEVMEMDVAD